VGQPVQHGGVKLILISGGSCAACRYRVASSIVVGRRMTLSVLGSAADLALLAAGGRVWDGWRLESIGLRGGMWSTR
jgi:hypothetical protein